MKLIVLISVLFGVVLGIFIHSALMDGAYLREKAVRGELLLENKRLRQYLELCGCFQEESPFDDIDTTSVEIRGSMITIGRKNIYKIYTKKEADELGIKYRDWRDCNKGDWVLSDDDWVMQCINRYFDENGKPRLWTYRFPEANVVRYAKKFNWQEFRDSYNKGMGSAKVRLDMEGRIYVRLVCRGVDPRHAVKIVWPKIKRINDKIYRLVNKEDFEKMMTKELLAACEENKVDNPWMIKNMKKIVNSWMESGEPRDKKYAFDGLVKMMELINGEIFRKQQEHVRKTLKESAGGGSLTAGEMAGIKEESDADGILMEREYIPIDGKDNGGG